MKKYLIKQFNKDYTFLKDYLTLKGSRKKRLVLTKESELAFFKYEEPKYNATEACSEKLSCEIARHIGYKTAMIDFAYDENNVLGTLNYWFISSDQELFDMIVFLKKNNLERHEFLKLSYIKKELDNKNLKLFTEFIKLMIFDALIGETDRHEENWGLIKKSNEYSFAPFYDNACNLLRNYKDEARQKKFKDNNKMDSFIKKSQTYIYKEDSKSRFRHFELIEYLYSKYPDIVKKEILKLKKLKNKNIEDIVNRVPNELLSDLHKELIIEYLEKRRNVLLEIITGG